MAHGNRRIARALYDRAGRMEKKQADQFFEGLDSNRDKKISLEEFLSGVESALSTEKVFNELDSNRDRFLDFDDVLVLFYYNVKKAIIILRCHGCSILIFGPSFSCFECLFNTADRRFALCRDCYDKGQVEHFHPLMSTSASTATGDELLRDQDLLLKFSDLISPYPRPIAKTKLKYLWEEAKSIIGAASHEVEAMADTYFESMGSNNALDLKKFSTRLTKQQEEFLTPRPDSHPATNDAKIALRDKLVGLQTHSANHNTASASTRQTHSVKSSTHCPNHETSSKGISPLKIVTTTFEIVDMALTIASLSSMCTIM